MWISGLAGAAAALFGVAVERLRPAGRARSRARRATREVERELQRIEKLELTAEKSLARVAEAWSRASEHRRLEQLDVSELKAFGADGVRWGVLEGAAYRTIADLIGVSKEKLTKLDGIGDVMADKIVRARDRVVALNKDEIVDPPQPDDETPPARNVRRAAHDSLVVRERTRGPRARLSTWLEGLQRRVHDIRRNAAFYRGLTSGRRAMREDAIATSKALVHEVHQGREPSGRLATAKLARKSAKLALRHHPTDADLAREHAHRMAEFTAVIERALVLRRSASIAASSAVTGGLPIEVARRVERSSLDSRGLRVTLRGYQEFGAKYLLVQRRTLLGDEMGLGKTVQALAAFAHVAYAEGGKLFLVVAPASVLTNWSRETTRRTTLPVTILHGNEREPRLRQWIQDGGVAVTSFGTLRLLPLFDGPHVVHRIDMLVVDEAHYAKNRSAARTQAIAALAARSERVCYMSGTPLENRLPEFHALIGQLQPQLASSLEDDAPSDDGLVIGRRAFLTAVAPVYVRRNQNDVLKELPERIEKEEWIDLSADETREYEQAVRDRKIMAMRRIVTLGTIGTRTDGSLVSSKLDRLDELLDEYREEGRKVLVFSFFLDVLAEVAQRCAMRGTLIGTISGKVAASERQRLCDAFTEADGHAVLLGQIDAAGTGLNLQAASAVCLLEPQWKPSTEEQAVARAHRMGQTRSVMVHRFFASDTVDERMKEVLADKRELFDAFARESAVSDASADATETSLVRQVIDAEVARLGIGSREALRNE
ncbi:MAG: DEAD/DEAH box helicase [Planctomycetes bacterium]|nr:DEAD/DEAH box helicase [Planctomycetota bacterium]